MEPFPKLPISPAVIHTLKHLHLKASFKNTFDHKRKIWLTINLLSTIGLFVKNVTLGQNQAAGKTWDFWSRNGTFGLWTLGKN